MFPQKKLANHSKSAMDFSYLCSEKTKAHPNPPQREGTELPRSESTNPQELKNLKTQKLKNSGL